jgi:hypothetical protein
MHFKTFKDFINESIETIVDEPTASGVFAKIKKNKADYLEIVSKELKDKFDLENSGMLFPHQRKPDVTYYLLNVLEDMGETKIQIIFPDSEKDKEKEKLANDIADHLNKNFFERNPKIKNLQYAPTTTRKIANVLADGRNGNWMVMWTPKFFVRKTD